MIMIYELLRKILGKVRKVIKIKKENQRKSEESYENKWGKLWKNRNKFGESEESQRKNEESYEKTGKRLRKREECYEENEEI